MATSQIQRGFDTNKNPIDRRFLLFQLDLSGSATRQFTALNPFTAQRDSSNPGSNFKFIDPIDYENVASPLYWRRILDPSYKTNFQSQFTSFRADFLTAVQNGTIHLRNGLGSIPFRDITPLIKKIDDFSVSASTTQNDMTVTLGPTQSLADFNVLRDQRKKVDASTLNAVFNQLLIDSDISENDVIMTRVSYDNGQTFEMEYLGFVTKISTSRRYGSVDSMTLMLTGVSKIFEINSMIKQGAIRQEQFLPNIEVSDPTAPSIYESRFNSLDTKGIFSTIMEQVLALKSNPTARFDDPNLLAFYNNDDVFFSTSTTIGFQYNMFVLLTIELMSRAGVDPQSVDFARLFPKSFPGSSTTGQAAGNRVVLDSTIRAILEHGEHQTFNLMIASGFENFFAQMDNAQSIFSELRSHTFYDLFESRDGVIVCRPPRYNKVALNIGEIGQQHISLSDRDIDKILVFDSRVNAWDLKSDSDYFIKAEDLADDVDFDKNDASLRTRVDTQFMLRTVGIQDFPAGSYTDANLLARYGLRSEGPINNPNATNPALATLFGPIALNIDNAATRTATVRVWDTRKYQVGKLYFVEPENIVGYCIGNRITAEYQRLGVCELSLIMVRQVVDRPISDILKTDDEVVNFALMYLQDPAADKKSDPSLASKMRQSLLANGKAMLQKLASRGAGTTVTPQQQQDQAVQDAIVAIGTDKKAIEAQQTAQAQGQPQLRKNITVPMFKYVPTILDLMIDVEDNPGRTAPQETTTDTSAQTSRETSRRRQSVENTEIQGNDLYATELKKPDGGLFPDQWFARMAAAVAAQTPDQDVSDFFPPVGAYRYSQIIPTGRSTASRPSIQAVKTPFNVDHVTELGAGVSFSQLLLNLLASLDLNMKYQTSFGSASTPNLNGFPQLYGLVNGVYRLFGTNQDPRAYLNSVPPALAYGVGPGNFQASFTQYPNVLRLDVANGQFINNFFRIPAQANRFRLPYGHLVYRESLANGVLSLRFIGVSGGMFQITQSAPGQVLFRAGKGAYLFYDEAASTMQANFAGPGDDGTAVAAADLTGTVSNQPELTLSPIDGNIYFISPFTDITIERMLEWGLPAGVAGVRKSSDTASLIQSSNRALLSDKDQHVKGRAFDFCPEVLTSSSGSDLLVLGPTFDRLKALLQAGGFSSTSVQNLLALSSNTAQIQWNYLDGSLGGNSSFGNQSPYSAKMYYHVGVTDEQVSADVNQQKPAVPAATVPSVSQSGFGETGS